MKTLFMNANEGDAGGKRFAGGLVSYPYSIRVTSNEMKNRN